MLSFDDFDALGAFFDARVAVRPLDGSPRGLAAYREAILAWLVGAGMSQAGLDPSLCHEALAGRAPVRVFVWLEDSSRVASVHAIPEAALTGAQRAAFDALGSACFEARIHVDLDDAQLVGALWAMAWFGLSAADGASLDALVAAVAARGVAGELDVEGLRSGLGSAGPARADLDAPILACHTLRLAM